MQGWNNYYSVHPSSYLCENDLLVDIENNTYVMYSTNYLPSIGHVYIIVNNNTYPMYSTNGLPSISHAYIKVNNNTSIVLTTSVFIT